jgi:RND superfamily putative drug exporter
VSNPRATLVVVASVVGVILAASAIAPDRLKVAGFIDSSSESSETLKRLQGSLGYDPEPGMVILARSEAGFGEASVQTAVKALARTVSADPAVGLVQTAFGPAGLPVLRAPDDRQTLLLVHFRSADPDSLEAPIDRIRGGVGEAGLELAFGGYAVGVVDANSEARGDLVRAELIALPALALLLLLIFRGFVPALIPLVIGGASVAATFACLRILSGVVDVSIFAFNLSIFLGLGLAVDYGLLLVSRYREEAAARGDGPDAVRATLATAGRAVAFSGCAVAGACSALLLFPQSFIYSMGIGGIIVALSAAGLALLIAPALLLLAGGRVGRPRGGPPAGRGREAWRTWADWVNVHHRDAAVAGTCLLIAAAAPALLLTPTFVDLETVPRGYESRTVADVVAADFEPNIEYPVNVAIESTEEGRSRVPAQLAAALAAAPGVVGYTPLADANGTTQFIQLRLSAPPLAESSQQTVATLRALPAPFMVGGRTAEFVDLKASIKEHALPALALAGATTLLVLFLLTGSVLIPIKALIFNVLSLCAVFGLLVLIFQEGLLGIGNLIGYDGPAAIETAISVVIIASTFGLATDYSILLLSRITEEHEAGRSDAEAVAIGIERTGPVITSAALLLAVALLALTTSSIFVVKQLTIGQALGILIDATLIRMLLVPSFMRVFGSLNWWAPGPLMRLHGRIRGRAPISE